MHIGYIRVSSSDQHTARQLADVQLETVYEDRMSGRNKERPALQECLRFLRAGDTLHVHSIDRLARNLADLLDIIAQVTEKKACLMFHKEGLSFTGDDSPMQKLHMQIIGAVAEFERAIIKERQREGIALAKSNHVYRGRKRTMSLSKISEFTDQVRNGVPVVTAARRAGVSRRTMYRWLKLTEKTEP